MKDIIILNKVEITLRCVKRVYEEYKNANGNFLTDYSRQDAAILNLQRAIQATVDIAAHIVRKKGLAAPHEMKDLFNTLCESKIISKGVSEKMVNMIGFRNISVHGYQKLDINIVVSVIEKHLMDFEKFIQEILRA